MKTVKDGDLYRVVELYGKSFELRYGYYEEYEREKCDPVPIYPDFRKSPVYTNEGFPFVTQMQELCQHGESRFEDGCCVDCRYFENGEELIGICKSPKNKKHIMK
ncbi:MAG: hypothetical protein IJX02_00900 [Clostridia bacterium]|nr:hypothetical protein [Clostridia bacterium]